MCSLWNKNSYNSIIVLTTEFEDQYNHKQIQNRIPIQYHSALVPVVVHITVLAGEYGHILWGNKKDF
jgi:hypothetical protein